MAEDDRRGRGLELASLGFADEEGEGTGVLLACLARVRSALERERAEAPALLAELLAQPEERRRELAGTDSRFQTWGICELLLARALASGEDDPAESGRLAALALATTAHLDTQRHAPPVVADLEARAWGCLGTARLRQGDLAGAEETLLSAAACLAQGTGDLLVEGNLLEFEAAVRQHQGRPGEAAALLKQAASRYREIGDAELLARAERQRAQVLPSGASGGPRVAFQSGERTKS